MKNLSTGNVDAAINLVMDPKEERRKSKLERELRLASEKIQARELNVIFYEYQQKDPWALVVYGMNIKNGDNKDARIKEEFMYFNGKQWLVVPAGVRSDKEIIKIFRCKETEELFTDFRSNMNFYKNKYLQ